jgi:uncharacterized membrane protein YvlD (DUF360 family)
MRDYPRLAASADMTELVQRVWGSFLGQCVRRFLAMSGIDRCLMLSSQAFTALIPLLILAATFAPADRADVISQSIIRRFALEGDSADSVKTLFTVPSGVENSLSAFSLLLLIASGTSFTRRLQTMYRTAWEEDKVRVRSGLYAALGLFTLLAEVLILYGIRALVRQLPLSWLLTLPLSLVTGVVLWTSIPYLLLNRVVHWRRLLAGGLVSSIGSAVYALATTIYMPGLVERYTNEFGLFGITMAMIGWLLASAGILVASAAIGAEFDHSQAAWVLAVKTRFRLEDPTLERRVPSAAEQAAGLTTDDLRLLVRVLLNWLILTAGVWVATAIVPNINVPGGFVTYLAVSLLLGLVNAVIGILPRLVPLPFTVVTLGLSALVINTVLLIVTATITPNLEVGGLGAALLGALVISVVTAALEFLTRPIRDLT